MGVTMRRSLAACASVLLCGVALPYAALAQDTTEREGDTVRDVVRVEGQRPDTMVTDMALSLATYGTQVQVISAEEIETGGFTNFGEAAAGLIRGANVGYSPDEGEFTIRIDGGTDRDTLLLVDGVPYFDRSSPLEDIWPATAIDPRMIESVEIFRGGQSLYFGSNGGLGVVSVRSKQPDGTAHGELGFYTGSFKTRELYGNYTFPLTQDGRHSILFYGRSYETDAHELFDESAYADNVLALGGFHEFPYSFNSLGASYLWQIDDVTEFRAGASFSNVDFRDSFPTSTIYQPNYTEFPIYHASFRTELSPRFRLEIEGHYQDPRLHNTEVDARICHIPRLADLPSDIQAIAAGQGITGFSTAAEFEAFAAGIPALPAGCVTNPYGGGSGAATGADSGYYVNPETGEPYGTFDNPFPIGNPIGYVIQSTASFGDGVPTKGFGQGDQFKSGYTDYGINIRGTYTFSENFELVGGVQNTSYRDNSAEVYGVQDVTLSSTGVYGDLRVTLPILQGFNASLATRYDFNTNFDDQSIWRVGVRQNLPWGIYARASGGTSYSLPKIDEIGAFGDNAHINPGLQPQEVETMNLGLGIDGEIFGGTYNVELGYFDTEINNLFTSRAVEAVCFEYEGNPNDRDAIEANRRNIVPPDAFCGTAASLGLDGRETVAVNALAAQDIQGFTIDIAFDFEQWQADFSFTDMESLEPNPVYGVLARLDGTSTNLDFVVPGAAGSEEFRQSAERPEWTLSGLVTYTPNDRWIFALNPRWQGPEHAYAGTTLARMVDADGNRVVEDVNFGEYFVLNGSIQYFMGDHNQHRFLLRAVNILDEEYYERMSGGSSMPVSRAAVRGEIGPNDSSYYRQYGWNGKPRSFFLQYEYSF